LHVPVCVRASDDVVFAVKTKFWPDTSTKDLLAGAVGEDMGTLIILVGVPVVLNVEPEEDVGGEKSWE
jgi:hypothetical protein